MGSHLPRPPFCPVLFRGCAQTGPSPRPPPAGGTGVMHRQPCRSHLPLREPQRPQCRRAARPRPTSQVLGCGEREIKEEKATPRCGAWGLLLTLGPHLGLRDPTSRREWSLPTRGRDVWGKRHCGYRPAAARLEDASLRVSPLEGAWLARRGSRLGQEKPVQHTKAVMSPQTFLLKTLPFRQET